MQNVEHNANFDHNNGKYDYNGNGYDRERDGTVANNAIVFVEFVFV